MSLREPKPYWRDVPTELRTQMESLLGSPIRTATRVFGGYGPSATFRVFLADGRTVFAKGAGKGSNEENWRVVPLEEAAYRNIEAVRNISPAYLGSVSVDGWHLLLLEDLTDAKLIPPWTTELALEAVRGIAHFHNQAMHEVDKAPQLNANGIVQSWESMRDNRELQTYFCNLFGKKRDQAEQWFHANIDPLVEAASQMMRQDQPWGLIHTDIRSDNLRFREGKLVLFDWPSIAYGPLICDIAFFAPSIKGEAGPSAEMLMTEYKSVMLESDVTFPEFAERAAVAATAGYFASRAGRPPVPELPRLRQVQRLQLGPALNWATAVLGLPAPPPLDPL